MTRGLCHWRLDWVEIRPRERGVVLVTLGPCSALAAVRPRGGVGQALNNRDLSPLPTALYPCSRAGSWHREGLREPPGGL